MTESDTDFERDVAEFDREDVIERIGEAAHYGTAQEGVSLYNCDRLNQISVRAQGSVLYRGNTYEFDIESGDCNGTVLHNWERVD